VEEWNAWVRSYYIPTVKATASCTDHKILTILGDEDEHGKTYALQFTFDDLDHFLLWSKDDINAISFESKSLFGEKCLSFKTLMKVEE
jgi:hypothetical protein